MNILITVALFAIFAKWTAASTVDEPSSSEGVDMREIEDINLDIFPEQCEQDSSFCERSIWKVIKATGPRYIIGLIKQLNTTRAYAFGALFDSDDVEKIRKVLVGGEFDHGIVLEGMQRSERLMEKPQNFVVVLGSIGESTVRREVLQKTIEMMFRKGQTTHIGSLLAALEKDELLKELGGTAIRCAFLEGVRHRKVVVVKELCGHPAIDMQTYASALISSGRQGDKNPVFVELLKAATVDHLHAAQEQPGYPTLVNASKLAISDAISKKTSTTAPVSGIADKPAEAPKLQPKDVVHSSHGSSVTKRVDAPRQDPSPSPPAIMTKSVPAWIDLESEALCSPGSIKHLDKIESANGLTLTIQNGIQALFSIGRTDRIPSLLGFLEGRRLLGVDLRVLAIRTVFIEGAKKGISRWLDYGEEHPEIDAETYGDALVYAWKGNQSDRSFQQLLRGASDDDLKAALSSRLEWSEREGFRQVISETLSGGKF